MFSPSISDPMSFLYLDMLSNILIEDTKEFEKEFVTKMKFVHEQEHNCLENMKQLSSVDKFVESMKKCIFQTELELEENEAFLIHAEQSILRYETYCKHFPNDPHIIPVKPSNYLVLLKLLLSADRSAAQCNNLKEEIEQYNNDAAKHLESPKLIGRIIECHIKTLESLDKQLNHMQCMADNVAKSYDEIVKKLQISSLSNKLTCKMADVIKDICNNPST